jgi:hypothetical protein
VDDDLLAGGVAQGVPRDVEVLPYDERLDGTEVERLEGVLDTEAVPAGVLTDFVEVLLDELLLLDKLDVGERFGGQFDGLWSQLTRTRTAKSTATNLIEAIFASVAHIDDLDDLGCETEIEHVALTELSFKVGAARQD